MRSTYTGFYSTSDEVLKEIWEADSTLFVFDTNCLLNLYRCEDHTREEILKVMNAVSSRTWIPFQVGFEYQRNRRTVIAESIASLRKIQEGLHRIYNDNILSHGSVKKHLYNSLNNEVTALQLQLKEPIEAFINEKITPRIESKLRISEHDFIRDQIDSIINNNVGPIPTQQFIDEINKEGESRYEKKIPPGFKDAPKKDISFFSGVHFQDKFGDLYLWKEIINKAKADNIKNVVFICDDTKEDWWYVYSGETHGPLEALKTEICKESSIENFKLISQSTFLLDAKTYLKNINVSDESLKEVEGLSKNNTIEHLHIDYYDGQLIEKLQNSNNKFLMVDSSFDLNSKNIRNFLTHSPKDLNATISMHVSILEEYDSISHEAEKLLSNLRLYRNEIINIVGVDKYLSCKRELNASFRDASEVVENVRSRLDIINESEKKVDIVSHLTGSLYSKVSRLKGAVDNTAKIIYRLT